MTLDELSGSRWEGKAELWEDPLGDVAKLSDCTMAIEGRLLSYTWSYEGKAHQGQLKLSAEGAEFSDSWHQQQPVACSIVPGTRSLATVQYTYMESWGWRINLCLREPTGELVLQMTNVTPWGEEARAVRMVCQRAAG